MGSGVASDAAGVGVDGRASTAVEVALLRLEMQLASYSAAVLLSDFLLESRRRRAGRGAGRGPVKGTGTEAPSIRAVEMCLGGRPVAGGGNDVTSDTLLLLRALVLNVMELSVSGSVPTAGEAA